VLWKCSHIIIILYGDMGTVATSKLFHVSLNHDLYAFSFFVTISISDMTIYNINRAEQVKPQLNLPALSLLVETGATIATGSPGRRSSKRPTPSHLRRTSLCTKWFRTLAWSCTHPSSQFGTEPKSTKSCSAPHSLQHINTNSSVTSVSHLKVLQHTYDTVVECSQIYY